jgi:hypothetical protein
VAVAVDVLEVGLMHVLMRVLGPVLVGVGVLVRDVLVLVRGVRVRVSSTAVVVFVRVRRVMRVLFAHGVLF